MRNGASVGEVGLGFGETSSRERVLQRAQCLTFSHSILSFSFFPLQILEIRLLFVFIIGYFDRMLLPFHIRVGPIYYVPHLYMRGRKYTLKIFNKFLVMFGMLRTLDFVIIILKQKLLFSKNINEDKI